MCFLLCSVLNNDSLVQSYILLYSALSSSSAAATLSITYPGIQFLTSFDMHLYHLARKFGIQHFLGYDGKIEFEYLLISIDLRVFRKVVIKVGALIEEQHSLVILCRAFSFIF